VSDIVGARAVPRASGRVRVEAPEIPGTRPRVQHRVTVNRPVKSLTTRDIDGAFPRVKGFRTSRVVNPLEPQYNLASFDKAPNVAPKFVRDMIQVQDIAGAAPKTHYAGTARDTISTSDIAGSRPGYQIREEHLVQQPPRTQSMCVDDINLKPKPLARDTNPLSPVYKWNGGSVEDEGSETRHGREQERLKDTQREVSVPKSLWARDIPGAYSSYKAENDTRRQLINGTYTADIPGARPAGYKTGAERRRERVAARERASTAASEKRSASAAGTSAERESAYERILPMRDPSQTPVGYLVQRQPNPPRPLSKQRVQRSALRQTADRPAGVQALSTRNNYEHQSLSVLPGPKQLEGRRSRAKEGLQIATLDRPRQSAPAPRQRSTYERNAPLLKTRMDIASVRDLPDF
ncbi:hypothetical protein KIPB_005958, partial [Kipferlia bialata]